MKTIGEYIDEALLKKDSRLSGLRKEWYNAAIERIKSIRWRLWIGTFLDLLLKPGSEHRDLVNDEIDDFIIKFIRENFAYEVIFDGDEYRKLPAEKKEDYDEWIDQLLGMGIAVMNNSQIRNLLLKHPWDMYDIFRKIKGLKTADSAMIMGESDESTTYIVYTTIKREPEHDMKVELADTIFRNLY